MGLEREMREGGCQVVRAGREATEHSRGLISPGEGQQKHPPSFSKLLATYTHAHRAEDRTLSSQARVSESGGKRVLIWIACAAPSEGSHADPTSLDSCPDQACLPPLTLPSPFRLHTHLLSRPTHNTHTPQRQPREHFYIPALDLATPACRRFPPHTPTQDHSTHPHDPRPAEPCLPAAQEAQDEVRRFFPCRLGL